MKTKTTRLAMAAFALLALATFLAPLGVDAQDRMSRMSGASHSKPTVAIIRADWCGACQKLEPTMMKLMEEYGDRLDFVVLDVSNDEKTAASAATARKLGLSKFFAANKKKTSTVAIFGAHNKLLSLTHYSRNGDTAFDRETYVRAFDAAVAQAKQS